MALVACAERPREACEPAPAGSDVRVDDFERDTLGPHWEILANPVVLVDTSVLGIAGGLGIVAYRDGDFGLDQFSEAVVARMVTDDRGPQVAVRIQTDSRERYGFLFCDCRPGAEFEIKRDGLPNAPVLARRPGVLQPGDVMRIEVRGREIRGLLNGKEILSVTDSIDPPLCGGSPGLAMRGPKDGTRESYFESWSGGALN